MIYNNERITSMMYSGKWRARHKGSPIRSVTSEALLCCPTSHCLSSSSTANLSLSSSYSLTKTSFSASSSAKFGKYSAAIFTDMIDKIWYTHKCVDRVEYKISYRLYWNVFFVCDCAMSYHQYLTLYIIGGYDDMAIPLVWVDFLFNF